MRNKIEGHPIAIPLQGQTSSSAQPDPAPAQRGSEDSPLGGERRVGVSLETRAGDLNTAYSILYAARSETRKGIGNAPLYTLATLGLGWAGGRAALRA